MTELFSSPDPEARPSWRAALDILGACLDAADPKGAVERHLSVEGAVLRAQSSGLSGRTERSGSAQADLESTMRVFLVGAGKAAAGMATAVEAALGDRLTAGVAVTARGAAEAPTGLRTILLEAGHPLPDPAGLVATRRIARLLDGTTADDLVVAVISGGASALLEMPAGRIPLVDIQAATRALLACGAPIDDINAVRKHVSAIKGGGLARLASPAQLITLVLSDVVGSPIDVIASGPTVPDESTFDDAGEVLTRYELWGAMPSSVTDHIRAGMAGRVPETARSGDAVFSRATTLIVGDNASAAEAGLTRAAELGYRTLLLTTFLEGEAQACGAVLASIGKEIATSGRPVGAPACVIAGGETTVTLGRHGGAGGRNQELALAGALALDGWAAVTLAAMDTDGIDGSSPAAGALVDGTTAARARSAGLSGSEALSRHDSGSLLADLGDAIVSGPTGTNVNDLAILLVAGDAESGSDPGAEREPGAPRPPDRRPG